MDEPRDLDLKFRYASDTQLFDLYIVPEPAKGIETKGHLRVQRGRCYPISRATSFGKSGASIGLFVVRTLQLHFVPRRKATDEFGMCETKR